MTKHKQTLQKNSPTAQEIEARMRTMRSIEFMMGTQRERYDFRQDPDVMAMVHGEIDFDEFTRRTEQLLPGARKHEGLA